MTAYNIKRFLLDLLYPNKCPFCGEVIGYNEFYCGECFNNLDFYGEINKQTENITETFALFEYNALTSPFVYKIKEGGDGYAVSAAAKLLSDRIRMFEIDCITAVPTDSSRMRERGYNPPALIAREISSILGVKLCGEMLIKTRRTEIQKSLSARERRENLKGAFRVNAKMSVIPRNTLIIDDVRTTGSTLSEAAGVLLNAGAERVYAGVVAAVKLQEKPKQVSQNAK